MRTLTILLILFVAASGQVVIYPFNTWNTADPLMNGLIGYWSFDHDTLLNVMDYKDRTLTFGNGTSPATSSNGKIGKCKDYEASDVNGDYSAMTDCPEVSFSGSEAFTLSFWVNFESLASTFDKVIITKAYTTNSGEGEYIVWNDYKGSNYTVFTFAIQGGGAGNSVSTTDTIKASTWYNVVAWKNTTTDSLYICVNNGTIFRGLNGATNNGIDGTSAFMFGNWSSSSARNNSGALDGLLDEVGLWGRVPTTGGYTMIDSIYNNGNGWQPSTNWTDQKPIAEPAITVNMTAYWPLDETSGTRYDAVGTSHMLDTCTTPVGYVAGKIGNAANFNANHFLTCDDNAAISFPDGIGDTKSWTISFWYYIARTKSNQGDYETPISKHSSGYREYTFNLDYANYNRVYIGFNAGATVYDFNTALQKGKNQAWVMLMAWYDAAVDSVYISMDGKKPRYHASTDTTSRSSGYRRQYGGYDLHDYSNQLLFGKVTEASTDAEYRFNGYLDNVIIWKDRCPNSWNAWAMVDSVWNGGTGWTP